MMNFKTAVLMVTALFLSLGSVYAQNLQLEDVTEPTSDVKPVTDDEIKSLVKINMEIQPIQQELQGKMIAEVEGSGMEVMRFSELMNRVQQGEELDDTDASEEEKKTFGAVIEKLNVLEAESDHKIEKLIEDNGFDLERFQEVFMALQTDPEVQERFMAAMTEAMEQG